MIKSKQTKSPASAEVNTKEVRKKLGRPSTYNNTMPQKVYRLCLLGLRDVDLAEVFEVSVQTIDGWKREHPAFLKAIKIGREQADAHIAKSLYHRAKGYAHPDVHISVQQGRVIVTPIIKHYPPDTIACIFWLKNRQKLYWRDTYRQEHTGGDGMPIQIQDLSKLNLSDLTTEELLMLKRIGLKVVEGQKDSQSTAGKSE